MNKQKKYVYAGVICSLLLIVSYFIPITIQSGTHNTVTRLLGLIILHNVFIFIAYVGVILFLFYKGFKGRIRLV